MTAIPGASDGAALSKPPAAAPPAGPIDVAALRAEIEHTRAELGETVQALAAKADVRARLQESADDYKARVRENARTVAAEARAAVADAPKRTRELAVLAGKAVRRNPGPYAIATGAAMIFVALLIRWRRTR